MKEVPIVPERHDGDDAAAKLDWLLKWQVEDLGTHFRAVWDLYIKFYTAFLTVNVSALTLTVQFIDVAKRGPIIFTFAILNLAEFVTALLLGWYSKSVAKRQKRISCELLSIDHETGKLNHLTDSAIPGNLASWSAYIGALSHILLMICWALLWS